MLAFYELWDRWDEYYSNHITTLDALLEKREGISWLWLIAHRASSDPNPFICIWNKYSDGLFFDDLKCILDCLIAATELDPQPFFMVWEKFPQQVLNYLREDHIRLFKNAAAKGNPEPLEIVSTVFPQGPEDHHEDPEKWIKETLKKHLPTSNRKLCI